MVDIELKAVPPDAPGQITRGPGKRVLWRWICPGDHKWPTSVCATEDEPKHLLSEAAIIADPLCCYCRKERDGGKQR